MTQTSTQRRPGLRAGAGDRNSRLLNAGRPGPGLLRRPVRVLLCCPATAAGVERGPLERGVSPAHDSGFASGFQVGPSRWPGAAMTSWPGAPSRAGLGWPGESAWKTRQTMTSKSAALILELEE
jgi:hypothetical protein